MTRRARQLIITSIAFVVVLAPGVGRAAKYTQYLCQLPNGAPAPADGFLGYTSGAGTSTADDCLAGGPLSATVPGSSVGQTFAGQSYHAPTDTTIIAVRVNRSTKGIASPGNIKYAFLQTTDACNADSSCPSGIAGGEYDESGTLSDANFQVYCPDNPGCQGTSGPASIELHSVAIDLRDALAPTLTSPPSGGMFSTTRSLHGQEPVSFSATDDGGGVFTAAIKVDGTEMDRWVVDDNGGACLQPFVKRVPCKLSATAAHSFDTTQLTDGAHTVQLLVYDATDVNKATFGPVDVVVDNTSPPPSGGGDGGGGGSSSGGSAGDQTADSSAPPSDAGLAETPAPPAPAATAVAARLVPGAEIGDGEVTTAFGRPARISGVLVDDLRRPIAHATLNVFAIEDGDPNARPVLVGTATTTDTGSFAYTVDPGPSRTITVAYRPLGEGSEPVATLGAHVLVRAALHLTASATRLHNGRTLTLTARVLGDKRLRRNAQVAFQVLIGRTWRTFARGQANRDGRVRARHRFHLTFTTVHYRFRALTLAARGFPYAPGHSRTVAVLVRP